MMTLKMLPDINYLLSILKSAYREFEDRAASLRFPKGAKTGMVISAIDSFYDSFSISDLKRKCPTVSVDMIRKILKDLNKQGKVRSSGRGSNARWNKRKDDNDEGK